MGLILLLISWAIIGNLDKYDYKEETKDDNTMTTHERIGGIMASLAHKLGKHSRNTLIIILSTTKRIAHKGLRVMSKFAKHDLTADQILLVLTGNEYRIVNTLQEADMLEYAMRENTKTHKDSPDIWLNAGSRKPAESMFPTSKSVYWASACKMTLHMRDSLGWDSTRISGLLEKCAIDYAATPDSERYDKFGAYANARKGNVADVVNRYRSDMPTTPAKQTPPVQASIPTPVLTGLDNSQFIMQVNGVNAIYRYHHTTSKGLAQYRVADEHKSIVRGNVKDSTITAPVNVNGVSYTVKQVNHNGLWLSLASDAVVIVSSTSTRQTIQDSIAPPPTTPAVPTTPAGNTSARLDKLESDIGVILQFVQDSVAQ